MCRCSANAIRYVLHAGNLGLLTGEAFMQMFDDAPRKRSKQEKAVEIEAEQSLSGTESAEREPESEEEEAGKAEEVVFESGR
jgi:hypothetical protein